MIRVAQVAGVGFGLDLTKRETQAKLKAAGLPWERSKAFTGSALFSDFVHGTRGSYVNSVWNCTSMTACDKKGTLA